MHGYKWPINCTRTRSFAIPIDMVRASVEQLIRHGHVQRPSLGLSIAPDNVLKRAVSSRQAAEGVLIMRVTPGSGAAAARLRPTMRDLNGKYHP